MDFIIYNKSLTTNIITFSLITQDVILKLLFITQIPDTTFYDLTIILALFHEIYFKIYIKHNIIVPGADENC